MKHPPIIVLALLWPAVSCGSDCTYLDERAGSVCGARSVETASLDIEGLPTVTASLGDRTFTLLLDTGAEATVISSSLLGRPDRSFYRLSDPLCIAGELCLEDTLVYAWDTPLSNPDPTGIQGVLGMDVLHRFTFKMFRNERLGLSLETPPCSGISTPVTYTDAGTATVSARIDDAPLSPLLIDTGAAVCLLSETTVAGMESYFRDSAVPSEGCTVNGCDTVEVSYIAQLCVGEVCLESVETKFPAWNALGGSFFRELSMEFDFVRHEVRFCND